MSSSLRSSVAHFFLKKLVYAAIFTLGVFSALGAAELTVTNLSSFVHASTNFTWEGNKLAAFPVERISANRVAHYNFSPVAEARQLTATLPSGHLAATDKRLAYEGYLGTGLVFEEYFAPVAVAYPEFLAAQPVYEWALEFYFYPTALTDRSTLLASEQIVWQAGNFGPNQARQYWTIVLEGAQLVTTLANLFHLAQTNLTIRLAADTPIRLGEWNKFYLGYHGKTGRLEQRLNDRVVATQYVSAGAPDGQYQFYLTPGTEKPVFLLGESFIGYIDELSFYDKIIPFAKIAPSGDILAARTAYFTATWSSRVFRLEPYTRIRRITWRGENIDPRAVTVYICAAEDYFSERTLVTPALSAAAGHTCEKGQLTDTFARPRATLYYQLFFVIKNRTYPYPKIDHLTLYYDSDDPPLPPVLTQVTGFSNAILLKFKVSKEEDIAGYVLSYKSERARLATKIQIPLATLRTRQQNAYEYSYLLADLENNVSYALALYAYDRILGSEERLSLQPAQAVVLTELALAPY